MSFRFALSYRQGITEKDQRRKTLDEIRDVENLQDHYVGSFKPGTTEAEKAAYWEEKAASERILLEESAR